MTDAAAPWGMLVFLGAFHGLNPGMGWLFAVALGMQENRARAVWWALLPLGVGHACAVALAIGVAILLGVVVPMAVLRWPIAALLIALGIRRLVRHRHPRGGRMRISAGRLAMWSFLVATAHGAGLMVLPVWLGMPAMSDASRGSHVHHSASLTSGIGAVAVHGGSYLLVTALIAWVVFSKLGVGLLRQAWINLDLIWAVALVASGAFTLLVSSSH
jgi:hypothetical protein